MKNEIRKLVLDAVHRAGKGHLGGVLSSAEILAALYGGALRAQDRFILSKGHIAVGLYAALALTGRFPVEELATLNQGGRLGEHPCRHIPGVEVTSGSLGHGLGLACGIALEEKLKLRDGRVFVLMGDGECWEGSVWEAAMFAAHHELNITVIVDRNGYAVQGETEEIVALEPLIDKWRAFGWSSRLYDGHDEQAVSAALSHYRDGPFCMIAYTTKGCGVSFMEDRREWHHGSLSEAQLAQATGELHGHA